MSYRTNRRTGGIFRTRDYSPAELESQSRRYTCPLCEAMLGRDVSPAVAQMIARESGHEVAGTPLASFISRAELNQHIRMAHPTERRPTKTHRRIGRGSVNVNITNTVPATPPSTATREDIAEEQPSTETVEEIREEEAEGGEGFTDEDGQIFDGQGGLLDAGDEGDEEEEKGGLLD